MHESAQQDGYTTRRYLLKRKCHSYPEAMERKSQCERSPCLLTARGTICFAQTRVERTRFRAGRAHSEPYDRTHLQILMCVCKCPETQTELAIHLKGTFQILEKSQLKQFNKGLITQNASFQHPNRVIILNRLICNLE